LPSSTFILFHGVPVQVNSGIVSSVVLPLVGDVTVGHVGAVVSITISNAGDSRDSHQITGS